MDQHVDVGASTRLRLPRPGEVPQMSDDGYPAVFEDQRTMLQSATSKEPGALDCENADDIFWNVWVPHLARWQNMPPRMDEENREVVPYLNAGRWIADCPACPGGAMACWDRNPYACCFNWGCGRVFKVAWQAPQLRSAVMRLLAGWPEGNRNWEAHKGETLEELKIQGVLLLGVPAVERNGLLVAANVDMPDEFGDLNEYLDKLRRDRRKAA